MTGEASRSAGDLVADLAHLGGWDAERVHVRIKDGGALRWALAEREPNPLSSRVHREFLPDPPGLVEEVAQALFERRFGSTRAGDGGATFAIDCPARTTSGTLAACAAARGARTAARIARDCREASRDDLARRVLAHVVTGSRKTIEVRTRR